MTRMTTSLAALAIALPAAAVAQQEENAVDMADVPQAAMEMATAEAEKLGLSDVTFTSVTLDDDGGTDTYEFLTTAASGKSLEIDVLADGTVEEIEEEIEMGDLPEPVRATLDTELSGFEPSMIEKSTRPDKVVYEFEGMVDGQEIDAEIDEDGSNFMQAGDMEG